MPQGEAIDGRIIMGRQRDRGDQILRQDAPVGIGQGRRFRLDGSRQKSLKRSLGIIEKHRCHECATISALKKI